MGVGPKAGMVSALVKKKSAPAVPRDPPSETVARIWEEKLEQGHFYVLGSVVRNGEKSYLVRRERTDIENQIAVCLMSEKGEVVRWYSDWETKADEGLREAIKRAGETALVHSVMRA